MAKIGNKGAAISFASRIAAMVRTATLAPPGHAASAQVMAPSVPTPRAPTVCGNGVGLASLESRSGAAGARTAALEITTFKNGYDFRRDQGKAIRAIRMATAIIGSAFLICAPPVQAQQLPPSSPDALARALETRGIDAAMGFQRNGPIRCNAGATSDDWYFQCKGAMLDSKRGGQTAGLEIMVYKHYDFGHRDAAAKAEIARLPAQWKIDGQFPFDFSGHGLRVAVRASCHQARGRQNSPAFCLTPLSSNVMILTWVPPLEASSDHVGVSTTGGHDSSDDMGRSADLASLCAITVARFAPTSNSPHPPPRVFTDDIFRKH